MQSVLRTLGLATPPPSDRQLSLLDLPTDALKCIIARVPVLSRFSMARVCRRFNSLLSRDEFWLPLWSDAPGPLLPNTKPWKEPGTDWLEPSHWRNAYALWLRQTLSGWRPGLRCHWEDACHPSSLVLKAMVFGPHMSGKSAVMLRLTEQRFDPTYNPTIGVEFGVFHRSTGSRTVRIQVWDVSGDQRFASVVKSYYRGVSVGLYVYDHRTPPSPEEFRAAFRPWLRETTVFVIRSKLDLPSTGAATDDGFMRDILATDFPLITPIFVAVSCANEADPGIAAVQNMLMRMPSGTLRPAVTLDEEELKQHLPLTYWPWYLRPAVFVSRALR